MTPEQFRKADAIFQAAAAQPTVGRRAYISQACDGDSALRTIVEKLLKHDEKPQLTLEPALGVAVRAVTESALSGAALPVPSRIGAYRILRALGEGGFGVVYLAEQESPRRTIAIKILRWTMGSADMLRRFEYEAQLLGRLQHVGIAQIFEAGVADVVFDSGGGAVAPARVPYYTMEYIQGRNLLDHADAPGRGQPPLDAAARLEVVARVCDALQHAHQHGIIHRDLKPDNILVADEIGPAPDPKAKSSARLFGAQPKLLDFGVARALEDNHGATHTRLGQLVGTPAYMSPEQVKGDSRQIDTRSDVYAAGVLLYQLLTGRLPYEFPSNAMSDIIRVIEQKQPTPLRSSVGTRSLRLHADIEAIVGKALAKEPERRYASAAALGSDLRRFLADEPIEAKRDSALYLLRKNVQRYRGALLAAAICAMAFAIIAGWAWRQARISDVLATESERARNEAVTERNRANLNAAQLAAEVTQSNIARARALASAGNFNDAERLIWREFAGEHPPESALWGLRELYARNPKRSSFLSQVKMIRAVGLHPDGRRLALDGDDEELEIWDITTGKRQPIAGFTPYSYWDLSFSPRGDVFAAAAWDGSVGVFDADSGRCRVMLCAHAAGRTCCAFSADGAALVTGGKDGLLRVWETRSWLCTATYPAHARGIIRLSAGPAGAVFATGAEQGQIAVWDARLLLEAREHDLELAEQVAPLPLGLCHMRYDAHAFDVMSLAISHDDRILASAGGTIDRKIRLWDLDAERPIDTFSLTSGIAESLAFAADDRTLYAGGWFTVEAWDVPTRQRLRTISKGKCSALAFRATDESLIAAGDNEVRLWDVGATRGIVRLGPNTGRSVAYAPNGALLAASHTDGSIDLRSTATGQLLSVLKSAGPPPAPDDRAYRTRALTFDPNGQSVISVNRANRLQRWDVASGRLVESLSGVNFIAHQSVAFRPDNQVRIHATQGANFTLLQRTGTLLGALPTNGAESISVAYSNDGELIATTARDSAIHLWDRYGSPLAKLQCAAVPWGVTFSPNGKQVLAGTWNFSVEVFDTHSFAHLRNIEGHAATVWEVQFMPTRPDLLATCSSDGTVRIWEYQTGQNLATFEICPGEEAVVEAFHPSGRTLAVAGSDEEIRLLEFDDLDDRIAGNLECELDRLRQDSTFNLNESRLRTRVGNLVTRRSRLLSAIE